MLNLKTFRISSSADTIMDSELVHCLLLDHENSWDCTLIEGAFPLVEADAIMQISLEKCAHNASQLSSWCHGGRVHCHGRQNKVS